jgi:wyosine [tRNA(Phe)-imidazoG37] synthetase (radical SAM superfamily)
VKLSVNGHDRYAAGMKYVYPVVSRRAGGVSIGVNLNPNNACNFRCIYCQVPGLIYGKAPVVEIGQLERELTYMLEQVVRGDFMQRAVAPEARRLNDIALAGNGEPTGSPQFIEAIEVITRALIQFELIGLIKVILITNGSLIHRSQVIKGLLEIKKLNGEVWFKLDSVTREGMRRVNSTPLDPRRHLLRLRRSASLCPTWVQTCLFAQDGEPPTEAEQEAYLQCLRSLARESVPLRGVQLYTLARIPRQPEANRLSALTLSWLQQFAARVDAAGFPVQVSP